MPHHNLCSNKVKTHYSFKCGNPSFLLDRGYTFRIPVERTMCTSYTWLCVSGQEGCTAHNASVLVTGITKPHFQPLVSL